MGCYDGSPQTFDIAWAWSEKSLTAVDDLIHHSIFSPQPATQVLQKAQVVMTMGPSLKIWRMIYKVEFLGLIWSWCMHACVKKGWKSLVNQTYYYKTNGGFGTYVPNQYYLSKGLHYTPLPVAKPGYQCCQCNEECQSPCGGAAVHHGSTGMGSMCVCVRMLRYHSAIKHCNWQTPQVQRS